MRRRSSKREALYGELTWHLSKPVADHGWDSVFSTIPSPRIRIFIAYIIGQSGGNSSSTSTSHHIFSNLILPTSSSTIIGSMRRSRRRFRRGGVNAFPLTGFYQESA